MPVDIKELKFRIIKLKNIVRQQGKKYSEEEDKFIKDTIKKFREAIVPLSKAEKKEYEEKAKNYKKNLGELISVMEKLLQFIMPKFTNKHKKTAWNR